MSSFHFCSVPKLTLTFVWTLAFLLSSSLLTSTSAALNSVEMDAFGRQKNTNNAASSSSSTSGGYMRGRRENDNAAPISISNPHANNEDMKILMGQLYTECAWQISYTWENTATGIIDSNAVYWGQLLPPREQDNGHTLYRIRSPFQAARYWSYQIYEGTLGAETVDAEYKVLDQTTKPSWGINPYVVPNTHTSENGEYDIFIHVFDDQEKYEQALANDDTAEDQVIYLFVDTSFQNTPPYVILRSYGVDPTARHNLGYTNPSELLRPTMFVATTFNEHYDKYYDKYANSESAWKEYIYRTYLNEANYLWTQLKVCQPSGYLTNEQSADIMAGGSMYWPTAILPNFLNAIYCFAQYVNVLKVMHNLSVFDLNPLPEQYGCPVHQNKMVLFRGSWFPQGVHNLVGRLGNDAQYGVWCDNVFEKGARYALMEKVVVYKFKLPTFPSRLWSDDVPAVNDVQVADRSTYDMRYFSIATADTVLPEVTSTVLQDREIEDHYLKIHGDSWDRWATIVIAQNWDVVQNCIDDSAAHGGECLYASAVQDAMFLPWSSDRVGVPQRPTIITRNILGTSPTSMQAFAEVCDVDGGRACGDWKFMQSVMGDYYPDMKIYNCGAHDYHPEYQDVNYNQLDYIPYYEIEGV